MKKNKFTLGWFFISLLMAFAVTACDDEDDNVATVTFPEKQTIGGAASETKSLTFDAVADWTLTSSSTWCYFITEGTPAAKATEGVKEYSISGKAGKQTVTIGISDEGQDYDNTTVASITISMNGQEAVLAEVTRNAAGRTFKLYKKGAGDEWVEVSEKEGIEAGYNDFITYKAVANFRFAATNRPEWLSIEGGSIVGSANQEVEFGIKVVENRPDFSKYVQAGNINFQDEEGKQVYTYAVNYKGMNPEKMNYEGPGQWNWTVSMDGKTYSQTSSGISGSEETNNEYRKFVEYTITALNDEFEAIFVEEYQEYGMTMYRLSVYPEDNVNWMHMTKYDNGKVRITVDESSEERTGYVFVFPKALYEKIAEDPFGDNGLFEMNQETFTQELKYAYTENYLLMNFVQKNTSSSSDVAPLAVTYVDMMTGQRTEIELTKVEEEGIISDYGTDKIYSVPSNINNSLYIKPTLDGEWDFAAWMGDTDVTHLVEKTSNTEINIWLGDIEPLGQDIHVCFRQNYQNKIVLVIKK